MCSVLAARGRGTLLQRVVLLLLAAAFSGRHSSARAFNTESDSLFVGWQGESYKPAAESQGQQADRQGSKQKWIEVVSWKPRAFVHHNFLTDAEAEHIKKLAAPTLKRSTVVGPNGSSVYDDYRTSYGTFVKRKADSVMEGIEARLAHWAQLPQINGEDLQVLRYGEGQQYNTHMDSLMDDVAGPRLCTILLYLNDVPEGGETAFPDSNHWLDKSLPEKLGPFSACARGRVAFKPRKGDALMFWSVHPDGRRQDLYSSHTGCPVLKGVKWTATKWIHPRPFRPETYNNTEPFESHDPGLCKDYDELCAKWAKAGECKKNAKFMMGDIGSAGKCTRACGGCTICAAGDKACYNENRRKAGFLVYEEDDLDSDSHLTKA